MINWIKYDNDSRSIESHVTRLITDGREIYTGFHASTPNGYKWFVGNNVTIAGITHYAEINMPQALE